VANKHNILSHEPIILHAYLTVYGYLSRCMQKPDCFFDTCVYNTIVKVHFHERTFAPYCLPYRLIFVRHTQFIRCIGVSTATSVSIIQTYTTQTSLNFPPTFFSLAWLPCTSLFCPTLSVLERVVLPAVQGKFTSNLYVTCSTEPCTAGCTTDLYVRGNGPLVYIKTLPYFLNQ
jgi:hypothetical protein